MFIVAHGSPEFEEKQMELRVSLGVKYNNMSVRTDNCNDTKQGEHVSTTLLLNGMKVYIAIMHKYFILL